MSPDLIAEYAVHSTHLSLPDTVQIYYIWLLALISFLIFNLSDYAVDKKIEWLLREKYLPVIYFNYRKWQPHFGIAKEDPFRGYVHFIINKKGEWLMLKKLSNEIKKKIVGYKSFLLNRTQFKGYHWRAYNNEYLAVRKSFQLFPKPLLAFHLRRPRPCVIKW